MSKCQYSRYELEISEMSYVQLIKLVEYYNTLIDYLLYITDVRKTYPKLIVKQNK